MTLLLALAADTGGEPLPWLGPLIAIGTLLVSSGGIVAWRRLQHDKKVGVAQQETMEDDALSNRWRAIIESQTKSLLEPMTARLQTLETKVQSLEQELEASRRKYWSAVSYIRILLTWIARHLPPDIEATSVPTPPANVTEDI